jgi:Sulfotransferase domain
MTRSKPNLIIGGAPKCGTTAMANYLRSHPAVFVSDPKEPFYWASDMPQMRACEQVSTLEEYLALFCSAGEDATVVAEASTLYLYSDVAIQDSVAFNSNMKFLFMIRRPIEVAHAFHMQMCFHEAENEPDFEKAWNLQSIREKDPASIPHRCRAAKLLQYQAVASMGTQLERAFAQLNKQQVHVILFDDFKNDPASAYRQTLAFLGLEDDGRTEFPRENAAMKSNVPIVTRWMRSRPVRVATRIAKNALEGRSYRWAKQLKHRIMFTHAPRPKLNREFEVRLTEVFIPEVEKIEAVLGRDLTHWKSVNVSEGS